jgi:hypothetical protein
MPMATARSASRRWRNCGLAAAGPEAIFERFDADGDGSVSEAEFEQAAEAMRERRGGHGGPFGNRDRG